MSEVQSNQSLVEEYKALKEAHEAEINSELVLACKHLTNAENLCEKYSLSMYPGISFLSQCYFPESFENSKFASVQEQLHHEDLLSYSEYAGWTHSAVC